MTQAPAHEWTNDQRVQALLDDLRDNRPQVTWSEIPSLGSLYGRDRVWTYTSAVANALRAIRDEYGDRCLSYADADWDNRSHVAKAWVNTKTVDQVITDALEARPLQVAA